MKDPQLLQEPNLASRSQRAKTSFARSFTRMGVRDQLEVNSGRLYPYTAEDLARHGRALLRGRLPAADSRPRALTEATPPARPTPLLKRATSDVF